MATEFKRKIERSEERNRRIVLEVPAGGCRIEIAREVVDYGADDNPIATTPFRTVTRDLGLISDKKMRGAAEELVEALEKLGDAWSAEDVALEETQKAQVRAAAADRTSPDTPMNVTTALVDNDHSKKRAKAAKKG